ncbi:unnamed protein product [Ceratitis capitata]|uniref:(Mediterranean fruit fly) hypothetical protein n=1 Tax=Ceratitis capitata TaxID=7213 RepID=A0A811UC72_CERCA|nr:unnamed protein product [Ceratitis capitata]
MHLIRYYSTKIKDLHPHSTIKIFRRDGSLPKTKNKTKLIQPAVTNNKIDVTNETTTAQSEINNDFAENVVKETENYIAALKKHGIDVTSTDRLEDVNMILPKLHGKNIEEHFYTIAKEQVAPYERLLNILVTCKKLPKRPEKWIFKSGWTIYDPVTGEGKSVNVPIDDALIFDVEVCVTEGAAPTLATAVSASHWYSWVSPQLTAKPPVESIEKSSFSAKRYCLKDLIPLGTNGPKVIVGHNVSYDRARLREQYLIDDTGVRFVDTMSLHISVSGITSYQRALLKSRKETDPEDEEWQHRVRLTA